MKPVTRVLLLILSLALVAGAAVVVYQRVLGRSVDHPLAQYLPEDTLAYLSISNLSEITQGEIAAMRPRYPDVEQDLTRLIDKVLNLGSKATHIDRDNLKKAVTQIRTIDLAVLRATADGPQAIAMVESNDLLSSWALWSSLLKDGVLQKEGDFEGHAIYSSGPLSTTPRLQTFRVYVGLLDNRLLATIWTDAAPLREVMAATARPPARSLSKQTTYSRLAAELGSDSHYWAYVAGPPMIKTLETLAGPRAQSELTAAQPVAGWNLLEAATWGSILETSWARGYLNIHTSSPAPWYEAFHTPPTPRRLLRSVPNGSVMAIDVGLGDAADLWKRVDAYVREVTRAAASGRPDADERVLREVRDMERFFQEEFPREMGFAFEDLIATIGDEVCFAMYPLAGGQTGQPILAPYSFALWIGIKNSDKAREIEGALREKARGQGQWEETKHGTATVHTLRIDRLGGVPTVSYVLSEDLLLIASTPDVVKASLDAGSRGDGMTAHEAIRSGLDRIPNSASAVMLVDYSAYFQLFSGMYGGRELDDLKGLEMAPAVMALVEEPTRISLLSSVPRGYGWSKSLVTFVEKALDEALAAADRQEWQRQPGR